MTRRALEAEAARNERGPSRDRDDRMNMGAELDDLVTPDRRAMLRRRHLAQDRDSSLGDRCDHSGEHPHHPIPGEIHSRVTCIRSETRWTVALHASPTSAELAWMEPGHHHGGTQERRSAPPSQEASSVGVDSPVFSGSPSPDSWSGSRAEEPSSRSAPPAPPSPPAPPGPVSCWYIQLGPSGPSTPRCHDEFEYQPSWKPAILNSPAAWSYCKPQTLIRFPSNQDSSVNVSMAPRMSSTVGTAPGLRPLSNAS
jgi:hypothetical protein